MSLVVIVKLLCCKFWVASEGAIGYDAKANAGGLTCCRPKLVGECMVSIVAKAAWGRGNS